MRGHVQAVGAGRMPDAPVSCHSLGLPDPNASCAIFLYLLPAGVWTTREVAAGEELTLDWSCETGGWLFGHKWNHDLHSSQNVHTSCFSRESRPAATMAHWLASAPPSPKHAHDLPAIGRDPAPENDREFRHATCLCGSAACRGSFLYLSKQDSSGPLQQVGS